jgi:hypothetical protein
MPKSDHFLANDPNWAFYQPETGFQTHYVAVNRKTRRWRTRSISNVSTCREGLIHNIRQGLQSGLCDRVQTGPHRWQFDLCQTKDADLTHPRGKGPGKTNLKLRKSVFLTHYNEAIKEETLLKFVQATDIIVGPICVLLASHRPEGDWWKTDPNKVCDGTYIYWSGSDNFFLQHPALVSLMAGLYRQVALLCKAGYGDKIIESIDYREIEECLSTNNWRQALAIIDKTRPWIEVPCAKNGYVINFPFPLGYWRRLQRLQRGARRHGYEKLFDQSFGEGWSLEHKGHQWSGMYNIWGEKGKLTGAHRRLMELGRPLRRKRSGNKSATRSA